MKNHVLLLTLFFAYSRVAAAGPCEEMAKERCNNVITPGVQTCTNRNAHVDSCKRKEIARKGPNMDDPNLRRSQTTDHQQKAAVSRPVPSPAVSHSVPSTSGSDNGSGF